MMHTIRILALAGVLAGALTAQDEKLLRKSFDQLDTDKDGSIGEKEFPGNPALFALMDKNRDNVVGFDEYRVSSLASRYLAAARLDADEPRRRVSPAELANRRLDLIARFDQNKDGRIPRSEWTGSPEAFTSLDIDGNGVIDKRDRTRERSESDVIDRVLRRLPDVRTALPGIDEALRSFDKDRNDQLSERELEKTPFARLFRYADANRDGELDKGELLRLVAEVNDLVARRDSGYRKPRAPIIPFHTWDKNKDGRIDLKEWVEQKHLFKLIDLDRDAAVTEAELLRFKRSIEGDNFLDKFDLDGDGRVTFEEFGGSRAAFERADRNRDGVISVKDR